jgi:aminoglycoside phosphotransferase family enzyme
MDLDAWGRKDLSDLFAIYYNQLFPAMNTPGDQQLFAYYKSYRANVRAKVNSLRAKTANNNAEKATVLEAAQKYLRLMYSYFENHGFTH